jgi:hypothetical protein
LSVAAKAVSISYSLLDVFLLAIAARMLLTHGRNATSFQFLVAGLVSFLIANVTHAKHALDGSVAFGVHGALGALWLLSYLLWAVAALHPTMRFVDDPARPRPSALTPSRLLLLGGAALLVPITLTIDSVQRAPTTIPVIAATLAGLFVLIVTRLSGVVRAHRQAIAREQVLRTMTREPIGAIRCYTSSTRSGAAPATGSACSTCPSQPGST